ncbi:hypothetical protein BD779DRAFT_1679996 [Infundibulicybe gibba]|nr:hypothetical protein BD779DRAFT_1679996 [Infundibulicybe gibba]
MLHSRGSYLPRHTSLLIPPPLSRYCDNASATHTSSGFLTCPPESDDQTPGQVPGGRPNPICHRIWIMPPTPHVCTDNPDYVEYPPMHLGIANFNVPWHQLTTLTLCSLSIPAYEYLVIIRRCTSLQQCTINRLPRIDDHDRDRIMDHSRPPITLPSLHTLWAGFGEWGPADNHRAFFRALSLPRLRKFQPQGCMAHFVFWPFKTFQPVLGDTIQELDLSRFEFPESLPEALALVPNLEILWLGDDARDNPRRMVRPFGDGTVAPYLTTLYLEFVENSQFLLDILEARAAAARANCDVAPLNVMILRQENTSTNPPDEARMAALAEAGMRIYWGVTDSRKMGF